jgi:hypothetical protein
MLPRRVVLLRVFVDAHAIFGIFENEFNRHS